MPDDIEALLRGRFGPDRFSVHARARSWLRPETAVLLGPETGPLTSDRGHDAAVQYLSFRQDNPDASLEECLRWTIESWDSAFFPDGHLEDSIRGQLDAERQGQLDFENEVYVRDEAVIATALTHVLVAGAIEADARRFVDVALARQGAPLTLTRVFAAGAREGRARALQEAVRLVRGAAS